MYFQPWVGQNYRKTGFQGRRVLILGESHYQSPDELSPNFTIDCVRNMAMGANGHAFFTKVAKLFLDVPKGAAVPQDLRVSFWNSVAFCNYVQTFPGDRARKRPTRDMWEKAAASYPEVHRALDPELTVVLGCELAKRLPKNPLAGFFLQIEHPSSFGFQPDLRRPLVHGMLQAMSGT